ncbi:MAG: 1-acyl-sn-glycerol-3-phosphate acyltransferase [Deltaproteobacteria bacterium]|nr:1-acyl-sn-glycerol-3-phosphate acyltransferase [Deltaproteobacteria bacterium]
MRKEDQERAVVEVVSRVVDAVRADAAGGGPGIEDVAADVLYHERQRLEAAPPSRETSRQRAYYRDASRKLLRSSTTEQVGLVREMAERFAREVVGHFDPAIYALTTKVLPVGAGIMLNAISPLSLLSRLPRLPNLGDQVEIRGAVDTLRALAAKGTVILAPTHQSHMDSIVLGWALYKMGLPPFMYGAGLNLFTNPLLSFFMHHLGAYRVDRKKKAALYKSVLKEYATVALEYRYHNLFFPGGTRSRSGAVERKLKLGLLGAGLRAFANNLRNGAPKPNVYVVPCTLSYGLVLEAQTLVEDHLQEAGQSRYIIEDDEFSQPRRIFNFARELISLDSRIVLRVGEPLDPFGHRVLPDGTSVDDRGSPVDLVRLLRDDGGLALDPARATEVTRRLGESVIRALCREATFLSTQLLAFAVFGLLRARALDRDLFRFLRTAQELGGVPLAEVYPALERLKDGLGELSRSGALGAEPTPLGFEPEETVPDGLRYFGTYHTDPVLARRGDRLFPGDLTLLYYYRNRLGGFGLEPRIDPRLAGVA